MSVTGHNIVILVDDTHNFLNCSWKVSSEYGDISLD